MRHAFKEWAVICKALAEGRQALIIRKGGIAEQNGEFTIEHNRFWFYPTYVHQQRDGIRDSVYPLLEKVEAERPPTGTLHFDHFAEVEGIYRVHSLPSALLISHLHCWSLETIQKRFEYRTPGLYVLAVRVYRSAEKFELAETDAYAGCKSWVELEEDLPTGDATPVLSDEASRSLRSSLETILNPTAFA